MSDLSALARERFDAWTHDVLGHLYDTVYLRSHPLADRLPDGVCPDVGRAQRGAALRRVVLEAIEAMRPAPGVPANSHEWRGYRILELRYIEGLPPAEATERLHLSRSQFFREQRRIVDALSDLLFEKLADSPTPIVDQTDLMDHEIQRLADTAVLVPVDVGELLDGLTPMLWSLAQTTDLGLTVTPSSQPVEIRADGASLRQALLSIASQTVHLGVPAVLVVTPSTGSQYHGIDITVDACESGTLEDLPPQLGLATRLTQAAGGELVVEGATGQQVRIALRWRVRKSMLFVIDDNPEFAELYRRYLAGMGAATWRVESTTSGFEALARLAELEGAPDVILLDMLMPGEDGWQVLARLRELPGLEDTPVFICSVLDQPELARAMGAKGMLRKPVEQAALLHALSSL